MSHCLQTAEANRTDSSRMSHCPHTADARHEGQCDIERKTFLIMILISRNVIQNGGHQQYEGNVTLKEKPFLHKDFN